MTNYLLDVQPGLYKVIAATTGASTERYVHGPTGIHSHEDAGGYWQYMLPDALGSVRAEVNASGTIQAMRHFAPYGEPFDIQNTFDAPFGFTGEPYDQNGLTHLRARYYDSQLGRLFNLDPIELPNRYTYASGNPSNRVDPLGLFDWNTHTIDRGDTLACIAREAGLMASGEYNPDVIHQMVGWHNHVNLVNEGNNQISINHIPSGHILYLLPGTNFIGNCECPKTIERGQFNGVCTSVCGAPTNPVPQEIECPPGQTRNNGACVNIASDLHPCEQFVDLANRYQRPGDFSEWDDDTFNAWIAYAESGQAGFSIGYGTISEFFEYNLTGDEKIYLGFSVLSLSSAIAPGTIVGHLPDFIAIMYALRDGFYPDELAIPLFGAIPFLGDFITLLSINHTMTSNITCDISWDFSS